MNHSRWNILPPAPPDHFARMTGLPRLFAQLLYNRGLRERGELESFLAADERLAGDPFLLPGMPQAVSRVYRALLSGEPITIYGDFDTDGITATALLVQGLSALGARVTPYIPHRLNEGHGLRNGALERLKEEGASLIVTVDCGITGLAEVKRARRLGLDVVITDHHTPLDEIPEAAAVVDPKLPGSAYPFVELAGVGVAFKLLQALLRNLGREREVNRFLDFVALGTVADVMPLLGENRYLVTSGLKLLNTKLRPGIRELAACASLTPGSLDACSISWSIAPRLNTTGRLDHALPSYQLLMTDSDEEAKELAQWLEVKNAERQELTTQAVASAREKVLAEGISPILITGDDGYQGGVLGLAAGRLAEEFYRPAIVMKTGRQVSHGSCRSIPEFNLIRALAQCQSLFTRFGGHPQAAGFTIPTRKLPELKQRLLAIATEELAGVDLRPRLDIEAEIRLADLGGATFPSIQRLAPFGQANPNPTLLSREVAVLDCRPMGSNGKHLRIKLRQNGATWDCVAFGAGDCLKEVTSSLDIVYNLELDQWCGESRLRLNLVDFAPSHQPPGHH